jgi:hypothetical protein
VSDSNRNYQIQATFDRIVAAQVMLDQLWDDARRLRQDYGINMRDRYIERAQEHLVVVRDDFEQKVMKVKPTGSLDRQYEKDLS